MNAKLRCWLVVPLVTALVAGVLLAADGRHHWDEPTYLYSGVYQSTRQIVAGVVQPSGIPHFTHGRILHALVVKGVMAASGSGQNGYKALVAINLTLIICSIALIFRILRDLLPGVPERRVAVILLAMTPLILYLSFKVMGDNEGLLAALVATFALLRLSQGGSAILAVIATAGLSVAALSKNQMVLLPATFWAALCIVPIAGIDRRRLAIFGVTCGIAGFLLTIATLDWLGIGLPAYIASYRDLTDSTVPLVAKFINTGTELGLLWLLLPFALLSTRRKELHAFGLWFLLAMIPFVFYLKSIEARHIAVNIVAAGGLITLALEAIGRRVHAWGRLSDKSRCAVATLAVIIIMGSNAFLLAIMPHRVDVDQLRTLISGLDAHYGAGRYALLTSTGYTDFQIIRVLWPQVDARDISTADIAIHPGKLSRDQALDSYLDDRHDASIQELRALRRPLVYTGYRQTFAAENLRTMLNVISPRLADRLLGKVNLVDRLYPPATRWLWQSPEVRFLPLAKVGHYFAFEVRIDPNSAAENTAGAK